MRNFLLFIALILAGSYAKAQSTATFEALALSKPDTFYVNYSQPNNDVGFDNGLMHFPCVYDTAYGGLWSTGFAYSNKTDSVTSGYFNMYSAKAAKGYNGSDKYAVYWAGYGAGKFVKTASSFEHFIPQGVYITNSTYAYNSMKYGDAPPARKFGDSTGNTGNVPDWFKLVIHGYRNGVQKPDSVEFYLADFRFANNAQDYIIKDWTFVNLQPLGTVDSINFTLSSSDNHPVYGMNTPAYFCMDNFSVNIPITNVPGAPAAALAKVYPNPATNKLIVELKAGLTAKTTIYDMAGHVVAVQQVEHGKTEINTSAFANGLYLLKLEDENGSATVRFTKQ